LVTDGYRMLGEKYGQIYFNRVVKGENWQPLQPVEATRNGAVITVRFHVSVPPLVLDEMLPPPHQSNNAWKAGEGFEVRTAGGTNLTIESVTVDGDAVNITCAEAITGNATVSYALYADSNNVMTVRNPNNDNVLWTGTTRWGRLRDSDPFVGTVTDTAQPNWCVAFEMPVE
jgi:hypothetical protein